MATLAASMALIPCIAPVFGSWMLYWFDWRMQFFALMLVGLLVLLCATSLPESRPRQAGERLNFGKITRQFGLSLRHPIFMGYCLIGGAQFGALFSWISMSSFVVIDQLGVRPVYFGYTFCRSGLRLFVRCAGKFKNGHETRYRSGNHDWVALRYHIGIADADAGSFIFL
jgi:DHA1 family bicyclomycin/chloramphenicol resistance-like MFS transporter